MNELRLGEDRSEEWHAQHVARVLLDQEARGALLLQEPVPDLPLDRRRRVLRRQPMALAHALTRQLPHPVGLEHVPHIRMTTDELAQNARPRARASDHQRNAHGPPAPGRALAPSSPLNPSPRRTARRQRSRRVP